MELFEVSRQFNVNIQPQLALLQKTLLNVEGMGRVIDPDLDLWETAKPHLKQAMKDNFNVKTLAKQMKSDWPYLAQLVPKTPLRLLEMIHSAGRQQLALEQQIGISSKGSRLSQKQPKRTKVLYLILGAAIGYFSHKVFQN